MRQFITLASAAALVALTPAIADAKRGGNGNGNGHSAQQHRGHGGGGMQRMRVDRRDEVRYREDLRERDDRRLRSDRLSGDLNRNGILDRYETDTDGDGILDYRDRNVSRSARACPPGLANRNPACVPPGQARKMFQEGQRIPASYRGYDAYSEIPVQYRSRVPEGYRYIYEDDQVYVVDPQTRLVREIISLLGL